MAGGPLLVNAGDANGTENGILYGMGKQANGYEKGNALHNVISKTGSMIRGTAWYFSKR